MVVKQLKDTHYIDSPNRGGNGFIEPIAQKWWLELSDSLKAIAINEVENGNEVAQILKNNKRNIVLLSFESEPATSMPSDENIIIHKNHDYGNYCYDDTKCTYEDKATGCFLSFKDPNYEQNT